MTETAYHAIERVLNDFKNGSTYTDSIDAIQGIIDVREATARREAANEVIEKVRYGITHLIVTTNLNFKRSAEQVQECYDAYIQPVIVKALDSLSDTYKEDGE